MDSLHFAVAHGTWFDEQDPTLIQRALHAKSLLEEGKVEKIFTVGGIPGNAKGRINSHTTKSILLRSGVPEEAIIALGGLHFGGEYEAIQAHLKEYTKEGTSIHLTAGMENIPLRIIRLKLAFLRVFRNTINVDGNSVVTHEVIPLGTEQYSPLGYFRECIYESLALPLTSMPRSERIMDWMKRDVRE